MHARPLTAAAALVLTIAVMTGVAGPPATAAAGAPDAAEAILAKYAAAAEERDVVTAVKHLLDYAVLTQGEYAPKTAQLTHRYGVLLLRAGQYRQAVIALKTALERSDAAFGELEGESFDINMNLGYAYGSLGRRRIYGYPYFERALEILRQRGERESVRYVTALLNVVGSLADKDGLSGDTTTSVVENFSSIPGNERFFQLDYRYQNDFDKALVYLDEADELAHALADEDEYLVAKVAIARAKFQVLETADLASVGMGVRGRLSQRSVIERSDVTEGELIDAIEVLSEDPETNAEFLAVANATLLEVAWLNNDRERMLALCASGALDSSTNYPRDRIFRVAADGTVMAPEFGYYVPLNLFENRHRRRKPPLDAQGNRIAQPYFIPVCVDGELKAALVNAPRVVIEEFE